MGQAEKNLTNLEKCCGLCVLPWNRVGRKHRPFTNSSTTFSSEKSSPITTEPKLRMAGDEGMPTSGYITRITNDDREEEMDDNLQLVSSYLGNLKNTALDMQDTISNQNKQIDRIADKNESGLDRVNAANKRTQAVLRKS
jgi:synaptosomal-associated protein 25